MATPAEEASTYISMLQTIFGYGADISVCVYTQLSDVELEVCDDSHAMCVQC